tara:strand:+ start:4080 stop:4544 length:465 start_codon:yes stop_codon:yes gene_type:complete
MVPSQASLVQLIEAMRPIQAPVVAPAPVNPQPAPIADYIADEKDEIGPGRVVESDRAFLEPESPIVSSSPSSAASASSSSSSSSSDPVYTFESLNKLNKNNGPNNLMDMATRLGIVGRHDMSKTDLIYAILRRNPNPDMIQTPIRRTIPRPRTK